MSTAFVMTDARIEANRANALRSTGPRTREGKAASRLNGLKHGLRAEIPLLPGEDADALEHRRDSWAAELRPEGELQAYLLDNAVAASIGIDRCRRQEAAALVESYDQAAAKRDDDEAAEAQRLADSLPDDPTAAGRLRRTHAGCRWLLVRWQRLFDRMNGFGGWDNVERNLAIRMLGLRPSDLFADPRVDAIITANLVAWLCGKPADPASYYALFAREESTGRTVEQMAGLLRLIIPHLPDKFTARASLREMATREIDALRLEVKAMEEDRGRVHDLARARSQLDVSAGGALRLRYMSAHQKVLRDSLRELFVEKKAAREAGDEGERPSAEVREAEEPAATAEAEPTEPKGPEAPAPGIPNAVEAAAPSEPKPAPVQPAPAALAAAREFQHPIETPNDAPHPLPTLPVRP